MPRRDSRRGVVHLLADLDALYVAEAYGVRMHPTELYHCYRGFTFKELTEFAAGIGPLKRGRPKSHMTDETLIAEVTVRRMHLSERSACASVARMKRVNPDVLRMRYRRAIGCRKQRPD